MANERYLGIVDETVFGTAVTPPTNFLDVKSIGLHPEREFVAAPSMIYSGPTYMAPAQYKCIGDIALWASADNLIKLFKHMFGGTPVSAADGTAYTHIFIPSDTLKFGTYYKVPSVCAVTTSAHQFISCIPTSMRIEARTGDPVSATFSMLGQKDAKVTVTALGAVSTVRPFFAIDGLLYWDIAKAVPIANVDSISLTYSRKIADDAYAMTDYLLKCFVPGEGTLEGEMDIMFTDWDAQGYFWSGVSSASAPIQSPVAMALDLILSGDASGGTAYTAYTCRLQCPKIVVTSVDAPIELRNKIMQTVSFKGYRGTGNLTTGMHLIEALLGNKIATVNV
jgi:hypothetical protein